MTLIYFMAHNTPDVNLLIECGVKNILVSYAYADKIAYDIPDLADRFENVALDSGSNTIKITDDDMPDYVEYALANADYLDMVFAFDKKGDVYTSFENYRDMSDAGVEHLIPIFQGDYWQALKLYTRGLENEYYAIGDTSFYDRREIDVKRVIRSLPKKHHYHGYAKGWMKECELFNSMDVRGWTRVAGGLGTMICLGGKDDVRYVKTNKNHGDRLEVRAIAGYNKDFMSKCGLDIRQSICDMRRNEKCKASIATYYMPYCRDLGIYDKNFIE